jgi:hypothetical protein
MNHDIARKLLKANGFYLGRPRKDGSWTAKASVIVLGSSIRMDFMLVGSTEGKTTFSVKTDDGRSQATEGALDEMATLAVSVKHRAEMA